MMLSEDSSFINYENQGEVVAYSLVVFSRCSAQRSRSKALWSLLHQVAHTAPSPRSAPSGPKTAWRWKKKLVTSPKDGVSWFNSLLLVCCFCGLGQTPVVQTLMSSVPAERGMHQVRHGSAEGMGEVTNHISL